ncbi:hypothetical protein PAMP_015929 [Pampus punctatissimus]
MRENHGEERRGDGGNPTSAVNLRRLSGSGFVVRFSLAFSAHFLLAVSIAPVSGR